MKTKFLTSVLIFISVGLFAQTTLVHDKNALVTGESITYREVQFTGPGSAGTNQIWDFSKIQFTGKSQTGNLQDAPAQKMAGTGNYNLSLFENGYDYFMNSTDNKLEELGYVNNDTKLTLIYSDPVLKMKYPFSYGDQYTDHFIGVARYSETSIIDFFGDYTVRADGYGTLILPDKVIENTLRVKSVKTGLQINMCGTTNVNIVKYSWYATDYRYPVLSLSTVENRFSTGNTEIINSAFASIQQPTLKSAVATAKNSTEPIEKTDITVIISPNPFNEKLTYNYYLAAPTTVSVELYDMAGQNNGWLVKNQQQAQGLHTGDLYAALYGLTPGVYFMRFTFDKQVIIRKVVKI